MNGTPYITVLSPAYNKGETIARTFESLQSQTCFDFEWLIVNDGSTDNTQTLIDSFQTDLFPIRIIHKENEGLNRTFNLGVKESKGYLVLRLDPDDYLVPTAIEQVRAYQQTLENDDTLCAVCFLTKFSNNHIVGYHPYQTPTISNFIDYRIKDKALGDRLEVVKRSVFLQFPMIEIENEKFCLESLMWNSIAEHYKALYIPSAIYVREYNEVSITSNLTNILRNNPKGTMLTYSHYIDILRKKQKEGYEVRKEIIKNAVNYYRFAFSTKERLSTIMRKVPLSLTAMAFIPGFMLYCVDSFAPKLVNSILNKLRGNSLNTK